MPFEPQNITKDHIFSAVEKIKNEQPVLKPSTRWEVIINGEKYPPKEIMRYAHQQMNNEFLWLKSGGENTNKWLTKFDFQVVEKANISHAVHDLINKYKQHTRKFGLKDELFKWKLIKSFNGRPNTNAPDFAEEITSINFSNLIYPAGLAVISFIAKKRPDEFRRAFQYLFNEEIDLTERIAFFNQRTKEIYSEIESNTNYSHHQDERTMATYLAFHDSSKYALYKDSFYQKYCKLIGVAPEKKGKKYVHYLSLLDEFIEDYILEDPELLTLKEELLDDECYEDFNHKIYAQDILYSTLDQQKGLEKSYWRIDTKYEGQNEWDNMFANQCISLPWSDTGDLNDLKVSTSKDIISILESKGHYINDKSVKKQKAEEIFNFYNGIQEGDVVLAQDGAEVLGIGRVIGDYAYDDSQNFAHYIPVHWLLTAPALKNTEGLKNTVLKLTQHNIFNEVEKLLQQYKQEQNMDIELNQILYGPPGTGKTYHTTNLALTLCGENISGLSRTEINSLFEKKVEEGRIVFTTFHQSMTYEDFVEGIKPNEPEKEGDPVIYRIENGLFRRLCISAAFSLAKEKESALTENVLDFSLAFDNFVQSVEEKVAVEETIELSTRNGGKVYVDGISQQGNIIIKHASKEVAYTVSKQRLSKLHAAFSDLDLVHNIDQQFRSVIGGSNATANWAVLNAIRMNYSNANKSDQEKIEYAWEDKVQVVKSMKKEDYIGKTGESFVFIIDEINRGNVSQIFGELITLIEEDKRLGNHEAIQVQLPYSKDWFGVPSNVFIIGTMNTADRSVEALDTALRRRFSFIEMSPKPELIKTEGKAKNGIISGIDLSDLLVSINKRIEKLLDKDHMIGHSYFLTIGNVKELKATFHNKIVPLLQEYFFGDYGKIGLVIGSDFFDIYEEDESSDFFAPFENYDSGPLQERRVYHLKNIMQMSDDQFLMALNHMLRK